MAKKKNQWYAWNNGHSGGVFDNWPECEKAFSGKSGEKHRGFQTKKEAWEFAYPGTPMPLSELDDNENSNDHPDEIPEKPCIPACPVMALDESRLSNAPISREVDDYCAKYGYSLFSTHQRRALQAVNGKFLLFAVPGSGKTTVLLARVGYMIHVCHIPANQIMSMTFTRAAAKEMKERYAKRFADDSGCDMPDFRTIHSFCMGVVIPRLRKAGYRCPHHVIDEDRKDKSKQTKKYTQRVILAEILKRNKVRKYNDETVQDVLQTTFSSIKNRDLEKQEYSRYSVRLEKENYRLEPLFEEYEQKLNELDCMDYDDILIYSLKGLYSCPAVLNDIRSIYHYWSIDESQDNSKLQHKLMDLLAGPCGNLFMVGDDDQSIYGFRGAEPGMLLEYGNRNDVTPMVMGTNFRSCSDIVCAAKAFIEHNKRRADKQMNAAHSEKGEIRIPHSFRNEAEQYAYIDAMAAACRREGKKLGVLYQLNASALPLIVHMHRADIPFEASKGIAELLGEKLAGSILRILRFVDNPSDLKLFNACKKDLGLFYQNKDLEERIEKEHKANKDKPILSLILDSMDEDDKHRGQIEKCMRVLQNVCGQKPSQAASEIMKEITVAYDTETLSERLYRYGFLSVCDLYDTVSEMLTDLDAMKNKEKQQHPDKDDEEPEAESDSLVATDEEPIVSLSTIHSAKGRQWDYVILIDSFEEVFPGAPQPDRIGYDPEEASRLFYVAVTRAIQRLDILTVEAYHGNLEQISSFISEFAYEADNVANAPTSTALLPKMEAEPGVICKIEPKKFYSVKAGTKPGVYTKWSQVEALIKGLSIPPEMQPRAHETYEAAWEAVYPGIPIPEERRKLMHKSIENYIQLSGGAIFNHPLDLPREVETGLLSHLHTESLLTMPNGQVKRLIDESKFSWNESNTVYRGRTDGYAVAYMPVNFYKIWLPLWKLLSDDKLPLKANVLEIGPGPGTSTWSLIEFYKRLALENPELKLSLAYTCVEREPAFSEIFNSIRKQVLAALPANLDVKLELMTGTDAFQYMRGLRENKYNLILESNALNYQESFDGKAAADYTSGLKRGLTEGGYAILVEPKELSGVSSFVRFVSDATEGEELMAYCPVAKAAVNLEGIELVKDSVSKGIRYSSNMEHWFQYAILSKKERCSA